MREEMTNQNHGLLALVAEQGEAIQNIQAAQLGIQERQLKVEKQVALEDGPKEPPPQVPVQPVFAAGWEKVGPESHPGGGSGPSSPDGH